MHLLGGINHTHLLQFACLLRHNNMQFVVLRKQVLYVIVVSLLRLTPAIVYKYMYAV